VTLKLVGGLGALPLLALAGAALWSASARGEAGRPDRVVREYWIAAVPSRWNVVPNGRNAIEKETVPADEASFTTILYGATRATGESRFRTLGTSRVTTTAFPVR
jgi:hypothetical protein